MRIVFISKYAVTPDAGKPTRQFFFSKELANRGHQVLLVNSRSTFSKDVPNFKGRFREKTYGNLTTLMLQGPVIDLGFNVKRLWSWFLFEFRLITCFFKIKKFKPDVFIVSSLSIFTFLTGIIFKRLFSIPLIIEVRDLYPLTLIEVGGLSKFNPVVLFLGWIEKTGYRNADYLVSSLENAKPHFEKIATHPVKYLWLPMGYEPEMYDSNINESGIKAIEALEVLKAHGKFIVGYAGSLGTANALDDLFKLTRDNEIINTNMHFVFFGSGPKKDEYTRLYHSDNVTFFPPVNRKYLPNVLNKCDVLVNTWLNRPIYQYGISPNKWIDYMFASRPVILALSANSRIFNEGDFGWQVPAESYDKLKAIFLDVRRQSPALLEDKGRNGKKYLSNNLSYASLTNKFEEVIFKSTKQ